MAGAASPISVAALAEASVAEAVVDSQEAAVSVVLAEDAEAEAAPAAAGKSTYYYLS